MSPLIPLERSKVDPQLFQYVRGIMESSNFLVSPLSYSQFQTQSRVKSDADSRKESLTDTLVIVSESFGHALSITNDQLVKEAAMK